MNFKLAAALACGITMATAAPAADLIVSTNDAKYQRAAGSDTFPPNTGPDSLNVIDASSFPPRVIAKVPVAHHPQGLVVNRAGTVLLAATVGGTVSSFEIKGKTLVATGERIDVPGGPSSIRSMPR